jgi:heme/copper-type cytochrome/quinol oxidase subunit 2
MGTTRATIALIAILTNGYASAAESVSGSPLLAGSAWVWICALVACAVFAVIIHSVIVFRPCAQASTDAKSTRNAVRESIWAAVPIAIVIAAAAPALTHLSAIDRGQTPGELQACSHSLSCRTNSLGQLVDLGPDHCVAAVASSKTSPVVAPPLAHVSAPCAARR